MSRRRLKTDDDPYVDGADRAPVQRPGTARGPRHIAFRFAARPRRRSSASAEVLALIDLVYASVLDPGDGPAVLGRLDALANGEAPRRVRHEDLLADLLHGAGSVSDAATIACPPRSTSSRCAASRWLGVVPHARHELGLARTLLPHLQRALSIRRQLDASERARRSLADGLDRLAVGVCVLDGRGYPLHSNRSARAVFNAGDGLRATPQGIVAACASDGRGLRAVIRAVRDPLASDLSPASTVVRRRSGQRPYVVFSSPLGSPANGRDSSIREPAVVLLIVDPEHTAQASDDILVRLFGMTPTEARVSVLLLQGRSVAEIQEALAITQNTARSHLKRIFAKTRTRGQADLIRTLLVATAIGAGAPGDSPI